MSSSSSIFLAPAQTRLITIAAHVDHGKTTLADSLIEHNGLIGERLAGTLRYLDSDPEEQRRGITMRSSAIGLKHEKSASPSGAGTKKAAAASNSSSLQSESYIIHLVDSPGHADFSWQVSSALTACDGCLLVVDVVEGMGSRTHQLLREVFLQQLVPVLVLNKMDRLCSDLGLSPTEAYMRLRSLIESVNAAASAMITSARHQEQDETERHHHHHHDQNNDREKINTSANNSTTTSNDRRRRSREEEAHQEAMWTFDPSKGNVIFASALFGWGFTSVSLARSLFRKKTLPIKPIVLKQCLFGDFKYKEDGQKIIKWKSDSHTEDPPLFAQFALQPLWYIYENVRAAVASDFNGKTPVGGGGSEKAVTIKEDSPALYAVLETMQMGGTAASGPGSLQIPTSMQELRAILVRTGANTEEAVLRALLRRYRPLASTILDVVCEYCPSPQEAASSLMRSRVLSLRLPPNVTAQDTDNKNDTSSSNGDHDMPESPFAQIQQAVRDCNPAPDAPCVAHVSKFFAAEKANVRDSGLPDDAPNNLILGLARVLSGRLCTGKEYYTFGPKHKDSSTTPPLKRAVRLYLLMGSSCVLVNEVPAGHLCAVYNLDDIQLKTVTLCDRAEGMPLRAFDGGIRPLVKVNVEPENAKDADDLERGLVKLSMADAAVEVTATAKGERILACLGELHLEQSILDLKNLYCGREIPLRISDPIVDFCESTDWFEQETTDYTSFFDDLVPPLRQTTIPPYNEEEGLMHANRGRMRSILSGRCGAISLRVVPLDATVHRSMEEGEVMEGSEEELMKLGAALNFNNRGDSQELLTPGGVLEILRNCLCYLGTNGNALIESPTLKDGSCARGIPSKLGEVHVPLFNEKGETQKQNPEGDQQRDIGKQEYEELRANIRHGKQSISSDNQTEADMEALNIWTREMKGSAVAGFQLAMRSGPICEEPVRNILVVLEGVETAVKKQENGSYISAKTLASGKVVSALRSGIRCALLTRPARLMEGYLRLTLNSSLAGLGALYTVLSKRRGKVVDDSMVDGTDLLLIKALIPQAEAFGLTPELFEKTKGEVTAPEMIFSHWARLDVDPFWIPTTEEEREDFGELQTAGDSSTGIDNTALRYIRMVRERKGLMVDSSRTVVAAEKQRTLKR